MRDRQKSFVHLLVLLLGALPCTARAQALWTWVGGSSFALQHGVYGTQGVAASTNAPGARVGSVSWVDKSGRFCLFGGHGFAESGPSGALNDLWRFDGANWTWVSGPNATNRYGVYGVKGSAASANVPGSRTGSVSWVDAAGNLWLFGGYGYAASGTSGYLNDLWKFDGTNWTWVNGSNSTYPTWSYGTKGVADPGNGPGQRGYCVSWTDAGGNFWLFGGWGYAEGYVKGHLNDLWKFDGTNWTWVNGSSIAEQGGVYGTKGVAAPANVPGARDASVSWTDASGHFWLFGGYGLSASGSDGSLNDLWRFDGTNWTWVSGSSDAGQDGVYGTMGVAASANVPGARNASVSWTDSCSNFWLFGGYAGSSTTYLADLWKFDGANWTWVSGPSNVAQYGVYGVEGVPGPGNMAGARYDPVSWTDASGNLWLFGGNGDAAGGTSGVLNDLWKFGIPDSAADISGNGFVDSPDLIVLMDEWETSASLGVLPADIAPEPAGDGVVNFRDFAVLASHWMRSI